MISALIERTNKHTLIINTLNNFNHENIISLSLSLNPELRYIQNLWALSIIDTKYVQNEPLHIIDRFSEEPYDTVVRILPKIMDLINNKFPEKAKVTDKIKRANIFTCLEELNLARKTSNFKLELIPKE